MDLSPLPITHLAVIPAEYMDPMGHMNVTWYTYLFDQATWYFFDSLGMSLAYFEEQNAGAFALENHTRFLSEVRQDQSITIRTRVLGLSQKRFHFMHFMVIENESQLAATAEYVGTHVDLTTRRSSPLPDHIAQAFDKLLSKHCSLDWTSPVCGSMQA